jgi:hypothetical protein
LHRHALRISQLRKLSYGRWGTLWWLPRECRDVDSQHLDLAPNMTPLPVDSLKE